jgi:hypothetical protein
MDSNRYEEAEINPLNVVKMVAGGLLVVVVGFFLLRVCFSF